MTISDWQVRWAIPDQALLELRQLLLAETTPAQYNVSTPENQVQAAVRVEAAQKGSILWRNNNGMAWDRDGNPIRFGLANDSKQMNSRVKSADLIGIRPVKITQGMVGSTVGQFLAREVKRGGWRYTGTEREQAQAKFLELVLTMGGDAAFAAETGTL